MGHSLEIFVDHHELEMAAQSLREVLADSTEEEKRAWLQIWGFKVANYMNSRRMGST